MQALVFGEREEHPVAFRENIAAFAFRRQHQRNVKFGSLSFSGDVGIAIAIAPVHAFDHPRKVLVGKTIGRRLLITAAGGKEEAEADTIDKRPKNSSHWSVRLGSKNQSDGVVYPGVGPRNPPGGISGDKWRNASMRQRESGGGSLSVSVRVSVKIRTDPDHGTSPPQPPPTKSDSPNIHFIPTLNPTLTPNGCSMKNSTYPFTHSSTHSLIHSFTHSLIQFFSSSTLQLFLPLLFLSACSPP